jgi:hypothetical protein
VPGGKSKEIRLAQDQEPSNKEEPVTRSVKDPPSEVIDGNRID